MAAFTYRAVDSTGKLQVGVVEANSDSGARQVLRERSLLPLSVAMTASKSARSAAPRFSLFDTLRPPIGRRALSLVTRQLSTLVGSDIRIEDALRTVAQQNTSTRTASVLLNVRAGILDGRTFAEALTDHPRAFPEYYRASIAAGEQSGQLSAVLAHLAEFVEGRHRTRQKAQLALLYPALLAGVSVIMIGLLLTYVVPDIVRVFIDRGADLPLLTRGLIALSNATRAYGWVVALLFVVLAVLGRQWLTVQSNRVSFHRVIASYPPTASFSRQMNSAQFAGTLATLIQSGVPLLEALRTSGAVTPNLYIRARVELAANRVGEGASLRQAVTEAACFPPMLVAMIASGESSGRLGSALARAAADQERELDALVTTLVALVEPAVLLFMGGVVLLMVLSILLPIIGLNDLAGR